MTWGQHLRQLPRRSTLSQSCHHVHHDGPTIMTEVRSATWHASQPQAALSIQTGSARSTPARPQHTPCAWEAAQLCISASCCAPAAVRVTSAGHVPASRACLASTHGMKKSCPRLPAAPGHRLVHPQQQLQQGPRPGGWRRQGVRRVSISLTLVHTPPQRLTQVSSQKWHQRRDPTRSTSTQLSICLLASTSAAQQ